uniref:Putative secreted protein n=1 Tax=Anopheles triannulatus TaxID=58253 RepID=A0A2M4B5X5_9DIPT
MVMVVVVAIALLLLLDDRFEDLRLLQIERGLGGVLGRGGLYLGVQRWTSVATAAAAVGSIAVGRRWCSRR